MSRQAIKINAEARTDAPSLTTQVTHQLIDGIDAENHERLIRYLKTCPTTSLDDAITELGFTAAEIEEAP